MNQEPPVIIDEEFRRSAAGSFYDSFYANISEELLEWRAMGAIQKCEGILALTQGMRPDTVLEIGAGTCSVISRLAQTGFGSKFYVLEASPSAVEYIRSKIRFPGLSGIYLADSTRTKLPDDSFDLGILSHVLEHAHDPAAVLREALRICRQVVLEVPLEDSLIPALEWRLRERIFGVRRTENKSGHIHFFSEGGIHNLIAASGGLAIRERAYRPSLETAVHGRRRLAVLRLTALQRVSEILFAATGPRFVLTHYGALVKRADSSTKAD